MLIIYNKYMTYLLSNELETLFLADWHIHYINNDQGNTGNRGASQV